MLYKVNRDVEITEENGYQVIHRYSDDSYFSLENDTLFILLSYNGLNNLQDIAKSFAKYKGISNNKALEYVEKIQKYLVSEGIIVVDEN